VAGWFHDTLILFLIWLFAALIKTNLFLQRNLQMGLITLRVRLKRFPHEIIFASPGERVKNPSIQVH